MKRILIACLVCSSFVTDSAAQTTVFSEDFQNGIPSAWTIVVNDTNTVDPSISAFAPGWISLPDPENTADIVAGATSFFTSPARANRWLITPPVTLGAFGNILQWEARSHDPSYPDGYMVLISTTDSLITSFTDTLLLLYPEGEFWTQRQINLSDSGYFSQTVRLAFVLRTFDAFKLYLDDISMRIDDPVGTTELTQLNTVIYPNPASATITLKGDQPEAIRIYSLTGALVYSKAVLTEESIDVSAFESGTYIVEMTGRSGISRQRFVKL